jgi:hypothetical protein
LWLTKQGRKVQLAIPRFVSAVADFYQRLPQRLPTSFYQRPSHIDMQRVQRVNVSNCVDVNHGNAKHIAPRASSRRFLLLHLPAALTGRLKQDGTVGVC